MVRQIETFRTTAEGSGPGGIVTLPIARVVDRWMQIDGCSSTHTVMQGSVTKQTADCTDGTAVEFISIAGAGHIWPRIALNATQTLYEFFFSGP